MRRLRRFLLPAIAIIAIGVPIGIVWGTAEMGSQPIPRPAKGPVVRDMATGLPATPRRARTPLAMPRVAVGQAVESDDVRRPVQHDVARPLAGIGATDGLPTAASASASGLDGWVQFASFPGLDAAATVRATGVQLAPPDPTMAVGRAANGDVRIIQWVNTAFVVVDGGGTVIQGPFAGNQVWSGFGGPCETTNRGDPLVRYDQWAGRWMMSQFAFQTSGNNLVPPYYQCVAVSRTQDPAGEWDRWAYAWTGDFNDYGKFGMTPGAYAFTLNMFPDAEDPYSALLMFDRPALLRGDPAAPVLYADLRGLGTGQRFGILPADPEGDEPRSTDGLPLAMLDTTGGPWVLGSTLVDRLALMRAVPDFTGGLLEVTVTQRVPIPPAYLGCALSSTQPGYNGCVPQAGGGAYLLDSLGDRLMYRLAWRTVGAEERLLATHTVSPSPDPNPVNARPTQARWILLARPPDGEWVLDDSGATPTAADGLTAPFRWMPSGAIDSTGGVTMVYGIASRPAGGLHASLAIGRHGPEDGPGTLQGGGLAAEELLATGSTNQTWTGRWGDYFTAISDPVVPCRVWGTGQYMSADVTPVTQNWGTWITAVASPDCADRAVPATLATPVSAPVAGTPVGATPATFTALDGSAISPDLSYQWLRCRDQQCTPTGGTGLSHTPADSDVGAVLRVKATARRTGGTVQTSIGPPSAVVAAASPAPTPGPAPSPTPSPAPAAPGPAPTTTQAAPAAPMRTPVPSIAARTGDTLTARRMARAARLARPSRSRVSYRVTGGPRSGLRVVRQDLRARIRGTYRVAVTVTTPSGRRTSRPVIVRVR